MQEMGINQDSLGCPPQRAVEFQVCTSAHLVSLITILTMENTPIVIHHLNRITFLMLSDCVIDE